MKDLVIGVDCSTTATKATVWDASGTCIAEARAALALQTPLPLFFEQHAQDWWESCASALREVCGQIDSNRLAALAITHQRETFVLLDEQDEPIRPGILWLDERGREDVRLLSDEVGADRLQAITGKYPDPTPGLYGMSWVRRHEPEHYARVAHVTDVHGYLALRLIGRHVTSWASADPLGLLDLETRRWSGPILQRMGLRPEQLPALAAPGEPIGQVTASAAEKTGLPRGLVLVAGGGDGQFAGLGVNVLKPGRAYLSLGTGAVSGVYADEYRTDRAFRTLTAPAKNGYILETCLRTCTYLIDWTARQLFGRVGDDSGVYERLEAEAARVAPGADGLLLLPYWGGVMSPYWDESARGGMVGLSGAHGQGHVYRAVLEGIALEQALASGNVERATGNRIEEIAVVGGGAASDLFCHITASALRRPVIRATTAEPPSLGAAIAAAVGVGWYPDFHAAATAMTRDGERIDPDPALVSAYAELSEIYDDLYPSLRSVMTRLADYRGRHPSASTPPTSAG